MSGVALGVEIAMVWPLRSCGPLSSARANTLCTTVCQWQPRILTSALRDPAMMAVAGEQPAQRDDVVLEGRKLELEALLGREAGADRHHLEAGIALRLDDRVAPSSLCSLLRRRRACTEQ